jgi:hypothetical protein
MIDFITLVYSFISIIFVSWMIYLFTIREWLDRFDVSKIDKPYDMNGIPRWKKLIQFQSKREDFCMKKYPKEIVESKKDRLTNWLIGLGLANAVLFLFIGGRFLSAIRGFLSVFGE